MENKEISEIEAARLAFIKRATNIAEFHNNHETDPLASAVDLVHAFQIYSSKLALIKTKVKGEGHD